MNENSITGKPWTQKKVEKYLKDHLQPERYHHVMGVKKAAKALGEKYGCDKEACIMAALFHDILKEEDQKSLDSFIRRHGESPGESSHSWKTMHAQAGAIFAKEIGGVKDEETLNAIRYHTTGRKGMGLLEKIIFMADYIEDGRVFEGVERVRRLAFKDLDLAMLKALDLSMIHLIRKGSYIMPLSLDTRNDFLEKTAKRSRE